MDATCDSCDTGRFLEGGICKECDNTTCSSCSSLTICVNDCNSECKTCALDGTGNCLSCPDGTYLSGITCLPCDY